MTKSLLSFLFVLFVILVIFTSFYLIKIKKVFRKDEKLEIKKEIDKQESIKEKEHSKEVEIIRKKGVPSAYLESEEDKRKEIKSKYNRLSQTQEIDESEHITQEPIIVQKQDREIKKELERKKISPEKRGGRPRKSNGRSVTEKRRKLKEAVLNIDIICWEEGLTWVIGAEISEKPENFCLNQNGEVLEKESSHDYRFRLKDLNGELKATWEGGEKTVSLFAGEKKFLIFKTRKNWNDLGRLVSNLAFGFYIIVVPEEWEINPTFTETSLVKSEKIHIPNYKAHFFHLADDEQAKIGFTTIENKSIQIESKIHGFQLKGKIIDDASENMGPIFVEEPPFLFASEEEWANVKLVVIGEEGKGRRRWKSHFSPLKNEKKQSFPDEFNKKAGGWYFIRIYDEEENLIESLDFRFMKLLEQIELPSYRNLPDEEGHKPVKLIFHHGSECNVLLESGRESGIEISRKKHKTEVIIPNHPSWDISDWMVKCDSAKIKVEIMIDRIWWSSIDNLEKTSLIMRANFSDQHIKESYESFQKSSERAFCFWFPRPRWAKKIFVGFDENNRKKYALKATDRYVCVPMRDFYDDIIGISQEVEMKVWITRYDGFQDSIAFCRVNPDISIEEESKEDVESEEISISLENKACCWTCNHARIQFNPLLKSNMYWCRRYRWPRIQQSEFESKHAHYRCAEWRGEYFDRYGNYITKVFHYLD